MLMIKENKIGNNAQNLKHLHNGHYTHLSHYIIYIYIFFVWDQGKSESKLIYIIFNI